MEILILLHACLTIVDDFRKLYQFFVQTVMRNNFYASSRYKYLTCRNLSSSVQVLYKNDRETKQ